MRWNVSKSLQQVLAELRPSLTLVQREFESLAESNNEILAFLVEGLIQTGSAATEPPWDVAYRALPPYFWRRNERRTKRTHRGQRLEFITGPKSWGRSGGPGGPLFLYGDRDGFGQFWDRSQIMNRLLALFPRAIQWPYRQEIIMPWTWQATLFRWALDPPPGFALRISRHDDWDYPYTDAMNLPRAAVHGIGKLLTLVEPLGADVPVTPQRPEEIRTAVPVGCPKPMNETQTRCANYIRKRPGVMCGRVVAEDLDIDYDHFRKAITRSLKDHGFSNKGYLWRPPEGPPGQTAAH
jgi:hypothetical protein